MGKRIFLLEDDQAIREIIEIILENEDYEVLGFENVKALMTKDFSSPPDLFLLDVMLPDGSGIEVCSQLKALETTSKVPVLMMSAHATLKSIDKGCNSDGFLPKPFDINQLVSFVQYQIGAA